MIKKNKGLEKATEVMAKRIMPKTDFEAVIEHDKLYWNTLNQHFEFMSVKSDILGQKAMKVLQNQTKESIAENIGLLTEWTETRVACLDLKGKLRIQEKLIEDKTTHFENIFLPQFNKEVKECKDNWEETYNKSKGLLTELAKTKDLDKRLKSLVQKIHFEHSWWKKVSDKDKKNEEFLVQIYKPLKRLNSAYDKIQEEIKKEEKFKV
jgi:hypothetical protein